MPTAAAAIPAIIGAVGAAASGGLGLLAAKTARKQAVEDQTRNVIKDPAKDFGEEMAKAQDMPTLSNAPIIFPRRKPQNFNI